MSVRSEGMNAPTMNPVSTGMPIARTEAAADALATINAAQNIDPALAEANDFSTNNVRYPLCVLSPQSCYPHSRAHSLPPLAAGASPQALGGCVGPRLPGGPLSAQGQGHLVALGRGHRCHPQAAE
eukprot:5695789-Prymnesium_polylepis.1